MYGSTDKQMVERFKIVISDNWSEYDNSREVVSIAECIMTKEDLKKAIAKAATEFIGMCNQESTRIDVVREKAAALRYTINISRRES
jgi:hypothetical protein